MKQRKRNHHALHESCFYNLSSPVKLAKYLFSSVDGIEALSKTEKRYQCWDEEKKHGGTRRIEAPHDNLKTVQRRIADILQRIEPPAYLMAPVKKRSYVHNAAQHIGANAFHLLDIEDFFPSCTDKRVFWFFNKRLGCAPHVAALLTKLTTYNGHLPQGSPCSPILAYFAYIDMWEEIASIVKAAGCQLSIYADDITISGQVIYGSDVWKVKQCLHRFGHKFSERKERAIVGKAADITGVIVRGESLLLPNRQHEKLAKLKRELRRAGHGKLRDHIGRQIRGRAAQAGQILEHIDKEAN